MYNSTALLASLHRACCCYTAKTHAYQDTRERVVVVLVVVVVLAAVVVVVVADGQ